MAKDDAVQTDFSDVVDTEVAAGDTTEVEASTLETAVLDEEGDEPQESTLADDDGPFKKPETNIKKKLVSGLLVALLAGAVGYGYLAMNDSGEPAPEVQKPAAEPVKSDEIADPGTDVQQEQAESEAPMPGADVSKEVSGATESLGDNEDSAGGDVKVTEPVSGEAAAPQPAVQESAPVNQVAPTPAVEVTQPVKAVEPAKVDPQPVISAAPVQTVSADVDSRFIALESKLSLLEDRVEKLQREREDDRKKIAALEKKLVALKSTGGEHHAPKKKKAPEVDLAVLNKEKIEPAKAYTPDLSSGGDVPKAEVNGVQLPHFTGSAIVPDRAWVTGEDGVFHTLTVGDKLEGGYGEVISIDDKAGVVKFSTGAEIRFW